MLMRSRITTGSTLVMAILALTLFFPSLGLAQTPTKLLISQVEIRGSGITAPNEYIVIKNPGSVAVDLSNYLTDATSREREPVLLQPSRRRRSRSAVALHRLRRALPRRRDDPAGAGAVDLGAGKHGLPGRVRQAAQLRVVRGRGRCGRRAGHASRARGFDQGPRGLRTTPTLSNTSEVVILFYWDGASDLVTDIDYVLWGTATSAGVDKTGISIDGPDADTTPTAYLADTPVASQATLPGPVRHPDERRRRHQTMTGGNGVGGRNETSENLASTFSTTPRACRRGRHPPTPRLPLWSPRRARRVRAA